MAAVSYSTFASHWVRMAVSSAPAGMVPAKARVAKMAVSSPSPTIVEPMVRVQSQRPPVATFMRARTMELANSPTRYARNEATSRRGV